MHCIRIFWQLKRRQISHITISKREIQYAQNTQQLSLQPWTYLKCWNIIWGGQKHCANGRMEAELSLLGRRGCGWLQPFHCTSPETEAAAVKNEKVELSNRLIHSRIGNMNCSYNVLLANNSLHSIHILPLSRSEVYPLPIPRQSTPTRHTRGCQRITCISRRWRWCQAIIMGASIGQVFGNSGHHGLPCRYVGR